ncbi:hypothetical protein RN001_001660 [Aquatica leii]|uniref:ATP-dependent RNA helicase n=1 Tax=Aquatica leii TaxID=1421715 RepID=A0AAN7SLF6_9COLE|nr:hypothetical protein RN001_001660 [Aquatica leii]
MELFVVNRHGEENKTVDEETNIARILKRIEKRKRQRAKRKEKQSAIINKTREIRTEKRQSKLKEGNGIEFISPALDDTEQELTNQSHFKTEASTLKGFTILGSDKYDKKPKIKRVLPRWLSNPTIISVNLQNLEHKVSNTKCLDKDLKRKLKMNGIKYLFPVQAEIVPWLIQSHQQSDIISPRDICVSAPTGSGKTLAFVLPVVQALKNHWTKKIRALVILPTQDLAFQVFKTFEKYVQGTSLSVSVITGKCTFAAEQNELIFENKTFGYLSRTDILICTAGRLVDHLNETKGFDLTHLKYLIIDEADRVLDTVQNDWLYHLEKHIYQNDYHNQNFKVLNLFTLQRRRAPQKLLFSATLSQDPEKIQKLSLFQPKLFTSVIHSDNINVEVNVDSFIGKYTTPKELTEKYIECSVDLKPLVLYQFIKQENLRKTIIFTHSVESTHRLTIVLQSLFQGQLNIREVSSRLETKKRNKLIEDFTKGNIDMIICTDKLARGVDLIGVQCVISYSVPKFLKTYIHRAGRTARAGELGLAVTLLSKTELNNFMNLLKEVGKNHLEEIKISNEGLESLGEKYKQALENLKDTVSKEGGQTLRKIKLAKRQLKKS